MSARKGKLNLLIALFAITSFHSVLAFAITPDEVVEAYQLVLTKFKQKIDGLPSRHRAGGSEVEFISSAPIDADLRNSVNLAVDRINSLADGVLIGPRTLVLNFDDLKLQDPSGGVPYGESGFSKELMRGLAHFLIPIYFELTAIEKTSGVVVNLRGKDEYDLAIDDALKQLYAVRDGLAWPLSENLKALDAYDAAKKELFRVSPPEFGSVPGFDLYKEPYSAFISGLVALILTGIPEPGILEVPTPSSPAFISVLRTIWIEENELFRNPEGHKKLLRAAFDSSLEQMKFVRENSSKAYKQFDPVTRICNLVLLGDKNDEVNFLVPGLTSKQRKRRGKKFFSDIRIEFPFSNEILSGSLETSIRWRLKK